MPLSFRIGSFVLAWSLVSASAAPISWQPVGNSTDPTVILTTGTLVEAVNATANTGVVTVNGVDFSPDNTLLPNNAVNVGLSDQETLDPGFDEMLDSVDFGGGTSGSLSVGGGALVSGQSYSIQVFYTDLRGTGRVMIFGDGSGNTVNLDSQGGAGSFGQFAIGIFVADGTTQTLSIETQTANNVHINGYQIRTTTPPPIISSFTESPALIASGESSMLSWQISGANTAGISPSVGSVNPTSGNATVSPTTTTTYILTATNDGGSVTSELTIGVDLPLLEPIISEFLASNNSGLVDENGADSDWIEIYNPNSFAIDLAGYHLTDTSTDPDRWTFPAGTRLDGDSYLVVFASGTSKLSGPLHTNFKLASDPAYLALVAPDGSTVIDQFNLYPGQRTDLSYGVASGNSVGYFKPPTPGAPNGPAFTGFVTDTSFDVDRGFFDAPFTVIISTPTPGATIVHTTDGTEPTLSNGTATPPVDGGTPGAASVSISGTTVLRAAAFKTGFSPTDIDTQTYLFAADIIEQPEMDPDVVDAPAYNAEMVSALKSVRSLSIVTDPDNLFDSAIGILENTGGRGIEWERPVSIEFIDPDNAVNSFQTNAGLRMHGNGSRGSAKNSLRLLFRGEYGAKKLDYPLFGVDWVAQKFNTVVLRAQNANSWTSGRALDRTSTTLLQDTFAKDTQGAMGHPTAGSTFVHLFLNGTYWGLYNPTERPDGSFGEDHFGGDDTDYDAVSRRFSIEVQSGTKTHWDEMIAHSNTLLDSPEEYEQMQGFIDVDNLIDYMLLHQFMQSRDGPDDFGHNNMRLLRRNNPPGPWQAYAWDMEYSMIDTTGTRDYSYPFPIYSSIRTNNRDISDSIASVYLRLKDNNPEFQLRYADRAYKHLYNGGALSEELAAARFEARAEEIESAVIVESARWGDHRRAEPYTRDVEWMTERNRLLNEFFPARPDHVVSQLRLHGLYPGIDPPVFNQHGGVVTDGFELTISSAAGTAYYTTDGSDPRLPGGAISPSAISYNTGIVLTNIHTHVMSRSLVPSTGE
ncbi:MAG: CotH kinase family protein [Verrucomicrobiales bacterium]|nr:CotH kinase family protein [Verrucomicrobiales bacterium]